MKQSFQKKYANEISAYTILAIPLFLYGVFFIYAFITVFYNSFTDWSISASKKFVFLDNYINAFKDRVFWRALANTSIWTFATTTGCNIMGLFIVQLIIKFKSKAAQRAVLTLLFWPVLVSATVSASIQLLIFAPDSGGIANMFMMKLGIINEPLLWIDDPRLSLFSLIFTTFFLGFGVKMVIYYAGMKNIPVQYYEAVKLETNSSWRIFWGISFPLLMPIIMFNIILSVIDGFKVIAPMQLITDGGPLYRTISIMLYLYKTAFSYDEHGYAAAIGFIATLVILAVTLVQFRLDKERFAYE